MDISNKMGGWVWQIQNKFLHIGKMVFLRGFGPLKIIHYNGSFIGRILYTYKCIYSIYNKYIKDISHHIYIQ